VWAPPAGREVELEDEVLEETVGSLVSVLVKGDEEKRPIVLSALTGLDVEQRLVVDALLSVLQHSAETQVQIDLLYSPGGASMYHIQYTGLLVPLTRPPASIRRRWNDKECSINYSRCTK